MASDVRIPLIALCCLLGFGSSKSLGDASKLRVKWLYQARLVKGRWLGLPLPGQEPLDLRFGDIVTLKAVMSGSTSIVGRTVKGRVRGVTEKQSGGGKNKKVTRFKHADPFTFTTRAKFLEDFGPSIAFQPLIASQGRKSYPLKKVKLEFVAPSSGTLEATELWIAGEALRGTNLITRSSRTRPSMLDLVANEKKRVVKIRNDRVRRRWKNVTLALEKLERGDVKSFARIQVLVEVRRPK